MAAAVLTLVGSSDFGNQKVVYGTYTASGATVGTLAVGLNAIVGAKANSSVGANNVSISWSAGTLSIVPAAADTAGYWMIYGY